MSEGNDKSKTVSTKNIVKFVNAVKDCIRENEAAIAELTQERDKYKELWEAAKNYIDKSPCDPDIYAEKTEIAAWDKLQTLILKHGE